MPLLQDYGTNRARCAWCKMELQSAPDAIEAIEQVPVAETYESTRTS